ncbi:unnamed protein product [Symbiodinium microadriaticum]|nr:unnamed protein product [Symbiodinium microadriaticum]CAE7892020.1 unnamed protein product [Symbiodinium sp. KB8]
MYEVLLAQEQQICNNKARVSALQQMLLQQLEERKKTKFLNAEIAKLSAKHQEMLALSEDQKVQLHKAKLHRQALYQEVRRLRGPGRRRASSLPNGKAANASMEAVPCKRDDRGIAQKGTSAIPARRNSSPATSPDSGRGPQRSSSAAALRGPKQSKMEGTEGQPGTESPRSLRRGRSTSATALHRSKPFLLPQGARAPAPACQGFPGRSETQRRRSDGDLVRNRWRRGDAAHLQLQELHESAQVEEQHSGRGSSTAGMSRTQFFLGLLFTAALNWADFFLDLWVVLQYGCVLPGNLSVGCPSDTAVNPTCEVHAWYFGLGFFLLFTSNLVQSVVWAERSLESRVTTVQTCPGKLTYFLACLLMSLAQLNYLVDGAMAFCFGIPELGSGRYETMRLRELYNKLLESAPQLYLQSYILFSIGGHGDPVGIASVSVSAISLAHGVVKLCLSHDRKQGPLSQPIYCFLAFLWLTTDQALRAAGFALVLSSEVRPFGLTLMVLGLLATCLNAARKGNSASRMRLAFAAAFGVYLIPIAQILKGSPRRGDHEDDAFIPEFELKDTPDDGTMRCLPIRWIETAGCAALSLAFARTKCGYAPIREVAGLTGLLLFNILLYALLELGFDAETGALNLWSSTAPEDLSTDHELSRSNDKRDVHGGRADVAIVEKNAMNPSALAEASFGGEACSRDAPISSPRDEDQKETAEDGQDPPKKKRKKFVKRKVKKNPSGEGWPEATTLGSLEQLPHLPWEDSSRFV